jgi:hypothetical protein
MTCVPDAGLIAFSSGPGELPNSKKYFKQKYIIN